MVRRTRLFWRNGMRFVASHVSLDDINTLQVGRPIVSRYHRNRRFFRKGAGVNHMIHDFPTASMDLKLGGFMAQSAKVGYGYRHHHGQSGKNQQQSHHHQHPQLLWWCPPFGAIAKIDPTGENQKRAERCQTTTQIDHPKARKKNKKQ